MIRLRYVRRIIIFSMSSLGLVAMAQKPIASSSMNILSNEKPEFFIRVNYYVRPIHPEFPISRADAEMREAFYVIFRSSGKIVRAEQWLVLREACARSSREPSAKLAAGVHFFKADGSWSSIPSLDAIAVDATYLQVTIGKNSEVIACERVAKQRILRHSYSYRDNGTLSRLVFETESGSGMDDYDEAGRRRN